MSNKRLKIRSILQVMVGLIIGLSGFVIGVLIGINGNTKIVHVNFDLTDKEEIKDWKYEFLDAELSNYIETLATELDIDSDLVVSILLVENPEFNPDAIHRNDNGTTDEGLFQLNDKYIYQTFIPKYWDLDCEFNPYNPKMNTFLAMHHIEYLSENLKVTKDIIAAYNCGVGAVMKGTIPESTTLYVKKVMNNLYLLKQLEGEKNA